MNSRRFIGILCIGFAIFVAPDASFSKAAWANETAHSPKSEEGRRDKLWSLFENETPNDIHCNSMDKCNALIDALLHRRGIKFIDPVLRTGTSTDARLIERLGRCNSRDIGSFDIMDGMKYGHKAQGRGPVTVYETSLGLGGQFHPAYRIEFRKLRHPNLRGIPADQRLNDPGLQGTTIFDLSTCEAADSGYDNLSGSIDTGFFNFDAITYRFVVGSYSNAPNAKDNYYWIIIDETPINAARDRDGLIFSLSMHSK